MKQAAVHVQQFCCNCTCAALNLSGNKYCLVRLTIIHDVSGSLSSKELVLLVLSLCPVGRESACSIRPLQAYCWSFFQSLSFQSLSLQEPGML